MSNILIKSLFFSIIFLTTLFAEPSIIIKNNEKIENFKIFVYEDKTNKLSIEDIKAIDGFKITNNNISNGFTNSNFWYKLSITNKSTQKIEPYLKMTESILDKIDFYILSNNIVIKHKKAGVGYFEKNLSNKLERAYIKVELEKDETKTIYIKISSLYPMFNSFQLMDKTSMDTFEHNYKTIYAFLIGSLLSLALYNLMIFFYTRDKSYIYYVLYSISFIIWQTSMSGLYPFNRFLDANFYYLIGASIPALVAFLCFFTNSILDIKSISKRFYFLLNFIGFFYLILTFWSILNFKPAILIMNATTSFILPLLIYVGYKSYIKGNKIAIFYLIAQGSFLSMATLFSFSSFGFLEYSLLSRHGIIVGSFIEMILFSLALAYRIKLLEEEKIIIIEKAKDELEIKVKKRTQELEESKKRFEILANKDYLSDLYNRRALFEISDKLISLTKREKTEISLLLFDLDKFKNINDTYGHKIGDEVIKTFAKLLKEKRRKSDIAARIGGEEFAILLPTTKLKDAYNIAEKIRKETEQLQIEDNRLNINFTVSCGVVSLENETKFDALLVKADKKLYEAKRAGRNRVCY
ncbi:sensor domain-containing diguanylate cyclase [Halarcobacter ebronensis]|uniref:sensor domain-containing diguanylate cyclase n=1 Tax=Halarcobacter ebronensis TaxID=1462615 RepID=UPI00155DA380|nr:diguanylate cyclase [Halarcobacter ebronensis]